MNIEGFACIAEKYFWKCVAFITFGWKVYGAFLWKISFLLLGVSSSISCQGTAQVFVHQWVITQHESTWIHWSLSFSIFMWSRSAEFILDEDSYVAYIAFSHNAVSACSIYHVKKWGWELLGIKESLTPPLVSFHMEEIEDKKIMFLDFVIFSIYVQWSGRSIWERETNLPKKPGYWKMIACMPCPVLVFYWFLPWWESDPSAPISSHPVPHCLPSYQTDKKTSWLLYASCNSFLVEH